MMQILSSDQWFISGFQQILRASEIENVHELVVFDSGAGRVYFTSSSELLRVHATDLLTLFTETRCYFLMKNASLDEYFYVLEQVAKNRKYPLHTKLLSDRERLVIQYYLSGLGQREIARELHLSERAVSSSKLRALQKLNVKSIQLFLLVMRNLQQHLSQCRENYC